MLILVALWKGPALVRSIAGGTADGLPVPVLTSPGAAVRTVTPRPTRTPRAALPGRTVAQASPAPARTDPTSTPYRVSRCPRPEACITSPAPDATVRGLVPVSGTATMPDFSQYRVEFRENGAADWSFLTQVNNPVSNGTLMVWDTRGLPSGFYWLRLIVVDASGNSWAAIPELRVRVVR